MIRKVVIKEDVRFPFVFAACSHITLIGGRSTIQNPISPSFRRKFCNWESTWFRNRRKVIARKETLPESEIGLVFSSSSFSYEFLSRERKRLACIISAINVSWSRYASFLVFFSYSNDSALREHNEPDTESYNGRFTIASYRFLNYTRV